MGDTAPEKVKMKIVEMLYSWTVAFPNEAKIGEAYQTLRRQGVLSWYIYIIMHVKRCLPQRKLINPVSHALHQAL